MQTPAAKQTAIVPVCPKCGIIGRSGKSSCCGRGGSWFGNCGSADNTKVEHRWYEGLEACKTGTRYNAVSGEESSASGDVDTGNAEAVIMAAKQFEMISSTPMLAINYSIGSTANSAMSNSKSTKDSVTASTGTTNLNSLTISGTVMISAPVKVTPARTNSSPSMLLSPATHTDMLAPTTMTVTTTTTITVAHARQEAEIAHAWILQGAYHIVM